MLMASPTTDSTSVVVLVATSTSAKPASAKPAATASASHGAITRCASGRCAVRWTCGSKSRSAQSLKAQPAQRITIVPMTNTSTSAPVGSPEAAIHSAVSVGHSSSRMPMGLSRRTSRS